MKKFLNLSKVLIIALCAVLLFRECQKGKEQGKIIKVDGKKYEVIKHEIDTVEVVKDTVIYKKGKDIYHDTTIYVQIPVDRPIDTLSILSDFFAKNIYKDTLFLPDSLGWVILKDTISQNTIFAREFIANVKQREIKETTIVKELPKFQVYWGLGVGLDKVNLLNSVGANLLYKTKTDKIYQFSLGLSGNNLTPTLGLGAYWKISLKR
jgi:hypothetical protein